MSIQKTQFVDEKELHTWVEEKINDFFGDVIYLPGNFIIKTKREKGAKPDGFVLDLHNSSWTIIETELIEHGVWEHIAEQIIRFIVATKNDSTKRKIRDYFFNALENKNLLSKAAKTLEVSETRIVQKIENILETTTPDIAIFIDEINEDLEDMVEALNATIRVYKIEKFSINGNIEFYYPERQDSTIETTIEDVKDSQGKPIEALELLGGGKFTTNVYKIKFYELDNGDKISIKYSKYYDAEPNYWYGITPKSLDKYQQQEITHLCFTVGSEGVIKLPYDTLTEYIEHSGVSMNIDNTIRHYHIHIRNNPTWELYAGDHTVDLNKYMFINE